MIIDVFIKSYLMGCCEREFAPSWIGPVCRRLERNLLGIFMVNRKFSYLAEIGRMFSKLIALILCVL